MLAGVIQSLVSEKGFGFIKPSAGGADVFFHVSTVDAPFESLSSGQSVKYELDSTSEKPRAKSVQAAGGTTSGKVNPTGTTGQSRSRSPQARSGPPRTGQVSSGQLRSGQARSGQARSGQARPSHGRSSQTRSVGSARPSGRPSQNTGPRDTRPRDTRRVADMPNVEHGFITKLHRKNFRGFISSIKHGPEFVFAAEAVSGEKRYSRLEIGDYVQFVIGTPDPDEPKQPVAKSVKVVEREVKIPSEKRLGRHPNSRKKKPTWR